MKRDKKFEDFWNRCLDRIDYMENVVDGDMTLVGNMIAIAYEAAMLLKSKSENEAGNA